MGRKDYFWSGPDRKRADLDGRKSRFLPFRQKFNLSAASLTDVINAQSSRSQSCREERCDR
ncbi:hypothetical protein J6590_046836 [Homalodisca vitripennis]|nr:hypothetical protein J6590_046836 [Homalodisca vitripennis]